MLAYYFGFETLWGLEVTPPVYLPAASAQTSVAYAALGAPWSGLKPNGDASINMSLFGIPTGAVCKRVQNHVEAGNPPVLVAADYSIWCPVCGFVNPEDTTVPSLVTRSGVSF